MTVQEVTKQVVDHMVDSEVADKTGNPEKMKENMVEARNILNEFLGYTNAIDEKPAAKEETEQAVGHCQPDQTNQEDG